jgi:hypothetical protein
MNALYPKFKQSLLTAGIDVESDDIKVVLVDTGAYTYSSAHQFLSDVAAGARVATSANLGGKTTVNGTFDASDLTLTAVTGVESEAIVIYQDTGVEGTSQLIAYMDTGVTGLPVTPNGGDITITWNAAGIFSL